MIKIKILNPKHVVYDGLAESIQLPGDRGDFELLPHHAPIVSILRAGTIVVDWKDRIPVRKGLMKCLNNECVILIEGDEVKPKVEGKEGAA
jgi:F-type H+-transporting ATPase subunit epsilon